LGDGFAEPTGEDMFMTLGGGRLAVDRGRSGCSVLNCREGRALSSLEIWERKEELDEEEVDTEPAAGLLTRELPV
jgi:hypothetical protein